MPIYEYRCDKCGHEMEAIQKMSDDPLIECPACGEAALRKLVSAAGFHLKGSGWYVTDFRDKGKKPGGNGTKSGGAKSTKDGPDSSKAGGSDKGAGATAGSGSGTQGSSNKGG
ncbi:MAG: zinc ribbon domain-containing protein [Gammaproteobacteria bacterium]|nr:zinc ribbon domain-containing protein [Gammaproteobacteria bacterium]